MYIISAVLDDNVVDSSKSTDKGMSVFFKYELISSAFLMHYVRKSMNMHFLKTAWNTYVCRFSPSARTISDIL
jgi:hypothetical protein